MKPPARKNPLFSACGLNCGLCPRYHSSGASKCPGCAGENFLTKHPACGILSCTQRHDVEYCFECEEFPCLRYEHADSSDSFISHKNQLKDLELAKRLGLSAYQKVLDEKMTALRFLLRYFNDGRRKSMYCVAANLLELYDVKSIIEQITDESTTDTRLSIKEKSDATVQLFQMIADKRSISLRLRKKPAQ